MKSLLTKSSLVLSLAIALSACGSKEKKKAIAETVVAEVSKTKTLDIRKIK